MSPLPIPLVEVGLLAVAAQLGAEAAATDGGAHRTGTVGSNTVTVPTPD
ncbi:MAG: hypothetical protein WCF33_05095 [Pseudonocardiaceae bacterium]